MATGARGGARGAERPAERRPWGDPSSGWLFHAPRRTTTSERFGIFRASVRSGGPGASLGAARHGDKRRGHAVRWAVLAVLAAMLTLFVCLLLIDFTRSERVAVKRTVNATARSFPGDEGVLEGAGVRRGGFAPNHRYPFPRPRDYGRSLKGHSSDGPVPGEVREESQVDAEGDVLEDTYEEVRGATLDDTQAPFDLTGEGVVTARDGGAAQEGAVQGGVAEDGMAEGGDGRSLLEGDALDDGTWGSWGGEQSEENSEGEESPDSLEERSGEEGEAGEAGEDDYPVLPTGFMDPGLLSPAFSIPHFSAVRADRPLDANDTRSGAAAETSPSNRTEGALPTGEVSEAGPDSNSTVSRTVSRTLRDPDMPVENVFIPEAAALSAEDPDEEGRLLIARGMEAADSAEDAVALPYYMGQRTPLRWIEDRDQDRDRDRWADLVRMQQLQQLQQLQVHQAQHQQQAARRQHKEAHRRNYYSEVGTIQGEHYVLPNVPANLPVSENLGPVLFPSSSKQQHQQHTDAPVSFVPKKLMKLMMSQQQGGKPRPFLGSNPNQYLVVNSKGVVIPHSVNFHDVVKSANFPQLQSYRSQQSSKHINDVINYLKSKEYAASSAASSAASGRRPFMWGAPSKLTGVYAMPQDGMSFPRSEPYVKEPSMATMASEVSESSERPDMHLNGHAYIADPFHPYKPSDPTEINQMASSFDSDTSASSERVRHVYTDEAGEQYVPPRTIPGRYGRYRNPYLQPGSPQFTEATFRPLGADIATSTSDAAPVAVPQTEAKRVPPLSVMLEIYPMGEAKANKDGAATIMWNNYPVAALRPVLRRPPVTTPMQSEASVRRPVTQSAEGSGLASGLGAMLGALGGQVNQVTSQPRLPVLMQGQLSAGQGQPAFGVTLSGLQGLQALQKPMLDSKSRMVLHLNFYPKKTVSMPMRFRDLSDHIGQGAALIPGGTFPQRRQSVVEEQQSVAVDVAPLLQSLPMDMKRHLMAILQTYQRQSPAQTTAQAPASSQHMDRSGLENNNDVSESESDEDYTDDLSYTSMENAEDTLKSATRTPVDAEPSLDSSSEEVGDDILPNWSGVNSGARERPWLVPGSSQRRPSAPAGARSDAKASYFDVQDDDYDDSGEESGQTAPGGGDSIRTTLSVQDRLALWRYWKDMQALRKQEDKQRARKRKKSKKTKKVGRSHMEDSSFERNRVADSENRQSIPKNHRME